jgi:hypothetical protein
MFGLCRESDFQPLAYMKFAVPPLAEWLGLAMAIGVAALLSKVLLPFEGLGGGNHPSVAFGVLLERRSYASRPSHLVPPSSATTT